MLAPNAEAFFNIFLCITQVEELLPQEHPGGHAARLRAKNRLVPAGFFYSVPVRDNLGYSRKPRVSGKETPSRQPGE
jgi:hypothetical protein